MTGLKLRTGGMSRSSSMTAGSLKPGREENGCGGFLFVRGPEAFGPFPAAACEDWKRPDLLPGGANWIAIAIPRRAATVCAASVPVGRPPLPPKAGSRTHRREHEVRPVWPDSLGGWGGLAKRRRGGGHPSSRRVPGPRLLSGIRNAPDAQGGVLKHEESRAVSPPL